MTGATHPEPGHLETVSGSVQPCTGSKPSQNGSHGDAGGGKLASAEQELEAGKCNFSQGDSAAWSRRLISERVILRLEIITKPEVKVGLVSVNMQRLCCTHWCTN